MLSLRIYRTLTFLFGCFLLISLLSLLEQNNKLKNFAHVEAILIKDQDKQEILLDLKDPLITQYILRSGVWEPHLQNLMKQIIRPGHKVIVLGGHVGIHALLMSRLVGESGKLEVFEPNPSTLKYLKINLLLNPIKNITLYEKAAFSENTQLKFIAVDWRLNASASYLEREVGGLPGEQITVDAVKLDSILTIPEGGFDILQMDVEGAEAQAVLGAEHIIDNSPNLVVLQEWTADWMRDDVAQYLKFWRDRGYRFAKITGDQLREISDSELMVAPQIDIMITKNLDFIIANFKPLVN